jgi:DNA-binding transcriptional MocR family regulator
MLLLELDRASAVPLYRQIIDSIVQLVDGGTLSPGDRLPPSRVLARSTGVHRSSVTHAYEELWALGYLEARPGSYSTVRRRAQRRRAGQPATPAFDWATRVVPAAREALRAVTAHPRVRAAADDPGLIDLSRITPDAQLMPGDAVRRSLRLALREEGPRVLEYGDPAGHRPLRQSIAGRLRTHGVEVTTDEVVITSGAQQALDLLLRALTRPGDRIAVESPTYLTALPLFRLHGLEIVEVPMRSEGMDLEILERALSRPRPPALVYTIPSFQNPTGITSDQPHRERLLALCERHRVPIVEDGFEEEMKYFGKAVLPIKSMDRRGVVAYVGTLSKIVSPGLRIGWIAAPSPVVEAVTALQRFGSLCVSPLAQAAVHRLFASGAYEAHLRRVHKAFRPRMRALIDGLREHLPRRGVAWTEPAGGYTLLLHVNGTRLGEEELHQRLLTAGVRLSCGRPYYPRAPRRPCFRVSIACASPERIAEGCRRMGLVLRSAVED